MSARRPYSSVLIVLLLVSVSAARTDSVRQMLRQGNRLYGDGQYAEAVNKYNEALIEQPQVLEPKFNKANSYYRLDDLGQAMDLYREVAAGSKDMALVTKAKFNLGNCFFQQGSKQRDSDLQKALEDMKTSITYWRQVLDIDPDNEKAARNIEVARLTIKDILDQLKQQQDQQNQQAPQNQSESQQDPNQPQDPNQAQPPQSQDPNQPEDEQPPEAQQQQQEQEVAPPDARAQEIIDREQRQKKEREIQQRARYQEVEKDW